jgi:short-subunit dehydrogenase
MRERWHDLTARQILITGGSRGLGLALAHACAQRGARVALLARDERALRVACASLQREYGRVAEPIVCDLRNRTQTEHAIARQLSRWGRVDVLINNAGIIEPGPAEHKSIADYEEAMEIHFWAPLLMMRAVIPGMQAQRAGRIVNISSVEGKVALPWIAPYSASKFALIGLSNALRAELASQNVYVTTVAPGLMRPAGEKLTPSKLPRWLARAASLPVANTTYERAARRIVRAFMHGQRWLELDLLSRLLMRADALAPETMGALLEGASRALRRGGRFFT